MGAQQISRNKYLHLPYNNCHFILGPFSTSARDLQICKWKAEFSGLGRMTAINWLDPGHKNSWMPWLMMQL